MITQSEAPAQEWIEVHKHWRDISALSAATVSTGLTGGTRASTKLEKRVPKKKKSLDLYPLRKDPIKNQDKNCGTQ